MNIKSLLFLSTALSIATAQAGTVIVNKVLENTAVNMVSGLNDGGLDANANTPYTNGAQELSFRLGINDAATGTTFEATLTLAGVTWGGANEVDTNPAGRIVFVDSADTTRNRSLTLTVSGITQLTGPAATATFDGFTSLSFDQFSAANDVFTFDGTTYVGNVDGPGGTTTGPVTLAALAPSGSVIDDDPGMGGQTGQFRMAALGAQFTVMIPEPSSIALLSLGLFPLFRRKR